MITAAELTEVKPYTTTILWPYGFDEPYPAMVRAAKLVENDEVYLYVGLHGENKTVPASTVFDLVDL